MTAVSIAWGYHFRSLAVFLILAGFVVLVARPVFRAVLEALTDAPRADVLGQVECGEYRRTVRGMEP